MVMYQNLVYTLELVKQVFSMALPMELLCLLRSLIFRQGYRLYVDNFYSSPKLFSDLLKEICGTVRSNRKGLPKEAVMAKLKKGEAVFKREKKTNMTFVHWKDQRDVFCLSTMHGNSMADFSTRRRDQDIQRPTLISDYKVLTIWTKC